MSLLSKEVPVELDVSSEAVSGLVCCRESEISRSSFQFNLIQYKNGQTQVWKKLIRFVKHT